MNCSLPIFISNEENQIALPEIIGENDYNGKAVS